MSDEKQDPVFIPNRQCVETSGACFEEGECLSKCLEHANINLAKRIEDIDRRLLALEVLIYRNKTKR